MTRGERSSVSCSDLDTGALVAGLKLMNPQPLEVRSSRIINSSLISRTRNEGSALSPPLLFSPWRTDGVPQRKPGFQRVIKMFLEVTACYRSFTMIVNHLLRLDYALGTGLCSLHIFHYSIHTTTL